MDLNELFSRQQIALIDMAHSPSLACREWAEECADYYAVCITALRTRHGVPEAISNHQAIKRALRG